MLGKQKEKSLFIIQDKEAETITQEATETLLCDGKLHPLKPWRYCLSIHFRISSNWLRYPTYVCEMESQRFCLEIPSKPKKEIFKMLVGAVKNDANIHNIKKNPV